MPNKLRELRGDKSLEEVSSAVGVSKQSLSYYERGQRVPRDSVKIALAKYYKRSVGFIFFRNGPHN